MSKASWTPWHQVVRLRDDLRTGELALRVRRRRALQRAAAHLRDQEFFALTYPTSALLDLARDGSHPPRAEPEGRASLELTHGGGRRTRSSRSSRERSASLLTSQPSTVQGPYRSSTASPACGGVALRQVRCRKGIEVATHPATGACPPTVECAGMATAGANGPPAASSGRLVEERRTRLRRTCWCRCSKRGRRRGGPRRFCWTKS